MESGTESEGVQRPIEYARVGEFHIAYTVRGAEGPTIVLMLGGFVPLDVIDSEPRLAGFVRRLERIGRVVLFNRRGIGLSDSVPLADPPTIEDWVDDLMAVRDAAGIETACVVAGLGDIKVAIAAAARAPDRIDHLISINGAIRPLATVLGMDGPESRRCRSGRRLADRCRSPAGGRSSVRIDRRT